MENGNLQAFAQEGRSAWLWQPPAAKGGLPLVMMPGGEDAPQQLAEITPLLLQAMEEGRCQPFRLACFASVDWNRDFSPWPAPALFAREEAFAGGAGETLAWLRESLLPALAQRTGGPVAPAGTAILGYSLAGLFALWAFYESGLFGAAGSCSGSLWYNGWADYTAGHSAPPGSRVYLSLGDKEEKARNPRMAAVGAATRGLAQRLQSDENVAQTVLEWHPGGHFANVPQRIAQGLVWLMQP